MDVRECCWVGSGSFVENRPPFPEGVAAGTYAAAVRVDGQLLNSIVFRIG